VEKTTTLEIETTSDELKGVKDVIKSFLIATKNYGLYPENHVTAKKFLSNIQNSLDVFLKEFVELRLIIKRDSFLYKGQIVYQEESSKDSLPLFLYRDGIQWIEFHEGLSYDEIITFFKLINQYKTPTADSEGDMVTALWEADLPNLKYEASDTLQGGEQSIFSFAFMGDSAVAQVPQGEVFARGEIPLPGVPSDLQHPGQTAMTGGDGADMEISSGHSEELSGQISGAGSGYSAVDVGAKAGQVSETVAGYPAAGGLEQAGEAGDVEPTGVQVVLPAKTISIADPDVDKKLLSLTAEEKTTLKQMVHEAEKKDSKNDVIELLVIILKEETNQQNFSIILQYLEEEFKEVLQYDDFGFAYQLLKSLNKSKQILSGEETWGQEKIEEFLHNISSPQILGILLEIREKIENLNIEQLQLLANVLVSLKPIAIETLCAFLVGSSNERISRLFEDIIVLYAKKDIASLTPLLEAKNEAVVLIAVNVLRKIEGPRSTAVLLDKMITQPSVKVRQQVLEILIERNIKEVKKLYPLLKDKDFKIRIKLLNFLSEGENTAAEDMLLKVIIQDLQEEKDAKIILSYYRTLGRCGSSRSIPYLKETLLAKSWKTLLGLDSQAHREGAASALAGINNNECKNILKKASESKISQIRSAYKKTLTK